MAQYHRWAGLALALQTCWAAAAPIDPFSVASLGTLNLVSGSYQLVTDGAGGAPVLMDAANTVLFTGTTRAQASAFNPSLGVLDFDAISIAAGVTVRVTGSQPLVLLSRSSVSLAGILDASGLNGQDGIFRGPGGAGAAGNAGSAGGGDGGNGAVGGPGLTGFGPGAGPSTGWWGLCQCTIGVGGGYGGRGQHPVEPGYGPTYGDLSQRLEGGSGGSGSGSAWGGGGGGGGGGGAIELGAISFIDVATTGKLLANGGYGGLSGDVFGYYGGGGSGGGLLLHAASITLDQFGPQQAAVHAMGGGYNGGGGRIAFFTASGTVNGLSDGYSLVEANVGTGTYAERGVITIGVLSAVPELPGSALLLAGLVLLGGRISRHAEV
nr:hypothetical protein [uncultured Roseateles sp.]